MFLNDQLNSLYNFDKNYLSYKPILIRKLMRIYYKDVKIKYWNYIQYYMLRCFLCLWSNSLFNRSPILYIIINKYVEYFLFDPFMLIMKVFL